MKKNTIKFLVSITLLIFCFSTYSLAQKATKKTIDDDVYENDVVAIKIVYTTYAAPQVQSNDNVRDYTKQDEQSYNQDNDQYVDDNRDYTKDNYTDNSHNYTARINRFNGCNDFRWRNYYGSSWGYDPFFDDPFYFGFNNFNRFGFGVGIGFGGWGGGWNSWNYYGSMNPWSPWGGLYSWYNPVFYGNGWGGGFNNGWNNGWGGGWNNGWGGGWNNGWGGNGWNNGGVVNNRNKPRPEGGFRGVRTDDLNGNNSRREDRGVRPTSGENRANTATQGNVENARSGIRPTRGDEIGRNNGESILYGNGDNTNTYPNNNNRPSRDGVRPTRDDARVNNTPTINGERSVTPEPANQPQQPRPMREQVRPREQANPNWGNDRQQYNRPERTESRPAREDRGNSYSPPPSYGGGGNYGGGGGGYGGNGGGNGGGGGSRPTRSGRN